MQQVKGSHVAVLNICAKLLAAVRRQQEPLGGAGGCPIGRPLACGRVSRWHMQRAPSALSKKLTPPSYAAFMISRHASTCETWPSCCKQHRHGSARSGSGSSRQRAGPTAEAACACASASAERTWKVTHAPKLSSETSSPLSPSLLYCIDISAGAGGAVRPLFTGAAEVRSARG